MHNVHKDAANNEIHKNTFFTAKLKFG